METFVAGYAIVWVCLVFYVGWMAQRQRRLTARYDALRRQMEAAERDEMPASRAA
jgi:CcmD family protein